jgi:hypothetical protein
MSSMEEACVALTSKIPKPEKEISVIQMELSNKYDQTERR